MFIVTDLVSLTKGLPVLVYDIIVGSCEVDCGWKSDCINNTCTCSAGYTLHTNGRDCKNCKLLVFSSLLLGQNYHIFQLDHLK